MYSVLISSRNEHAFIRKTVDDVLRQFNPGAAEILIVDDGSTDDSTSVFQDETYTGRAVRLVRNEQPRGLIAARAQAAELARGDFLVFLDAHCAVSGDWLEVLQMELKRIRHRGLVVPQVYGLDVNTWTLQRRFEGIQGTTIVNPFFDFGWNDPLQMNGVPCTCGIGGMAWMCTREWYDHLGGLDGEMLTWGGENLDFPMRTWLAGGRCIVARNAAVGHVFKGGTAVRQDPVELAFNKLRLVHTIFEEADFNRILVNLLPFAVYEKACNRIRESPHGLGRLKGHVETIRKRSSRWLVDTFQLPVFESPSFHLRNSGRKVVHRLSDRESIEFPYRPKITVILSGKNRRAVEDSLEDWLDKTAYAAAEFWVVLQGNSSGSNRNPCLRHPRVRRLSFDPMLDPAACQNLAGSAGGTDFFVIVDARFRIEEEHWVEKFIQFFESRDHLVMASPATVRVDPEGHVTETQFDAQWDWDRPDWIDICTQPRCGSTPYQAFSSPDTLLFLRRDLFLRVGGFEGTIETTLLRIRDFAMRAWLLGYEVGCHPGIRVRHRVEDVNGGAADCPAPTHPSLRNHQRMITPLTCFSNEERLQYCYRQLEEPRSFRPFQYSMLEQRRLEFLKRAAYSDDWLFYKFSIIDPLPT